MADRNIELRLTADDKASKVIGDVADELVKLEDPTEVEVTADTRKAEDELEGLERRLDDITNPQGRELVIDFRAERLEAKIESLHSELARLEDPMAIQVATAELEAAETELKDLAELAGRKYEVEVTVPEPSRPVKQPFDDIVTGADQANSAVANMVGNTGQDLGELAGVTGSAGVAVGQLAEYFADTAIEAKNAGQGMGAMVGSFAKAAVPIAGIAAAMWAIQKGAQQAQERTEDLTASVDELSTASDELFAKTAAETLSSMFARAALDGQDLNDQIAEMVEQNAAGARRMLDNADAIGLNADMQARLATAIRESDREAAQAEETQRKYGDAASDAADSSQDLADRQEDIATQAEAAAEQLNASAEAALAVASANRDAASAGVEYAAAQDEWGTALAESNQALVEAGEGTAAYRDVLRSTTDQAVNMADQAVALADAQARANGETLSASDATSTWNREMLTAARSAEGPLRQSIIDYIATVNGIPPEKVSEILANTNYATVEEAQAALDAASVTRDAEIRAEADTAAADNELDSVADKQRTANIDVVTRGVQAALDNIRDVVGWGPRTVNVNMPRAASARDITTEMTRWGRVNGG